jgi:hypothetical protein
MKMQGWPIEVTVVDYKEAQVRLLLRGRRSANILEWRKAQGRASELRTYDEEKPRKRAENHTMEKNDVGLWEDRAVASDGGKIENQWI